MTGQSGPEFLHLPGEYVARWSVRDCAFEVYRTHSGPPMMRWAIGHQATYEAGEIPMPERFGPWTGDLDGFASWVQRYTDGVEQPRGGRRG